MKIESKHNINEYLKGNHSNSFNVDVYKDTLLKATQYAIPSTGLCFAMEVEGYEKNKRGEIFEENIDSVSAIAKYSNSKTCVLNMASAKRPGGGVVKGAKAQEECLFRCSNLGLSISKGHYPLQQHEMLYTVNAVFFKDVNYNDFDCAYLSDVITCAAVNLNDNAKYGYDGKDAMSEDPASDYSYVNITKRKIEGIVTSAALRGVETLILGAWGCGVFKNDPKFIAQTFLDALTTSDRRYAFDRVVFAVINDRNSVGNNYDVFKNVIRENQIVQQ